MIFAILMIAAAIAATFLVGLVAGSFWAALAFAALMIGLYRATVHHSGPADDGPRHGHNAFQRWASGD